MNGTTVNDLIAEKLNLKNEEGWLGSFTRDSAPNAIANGTRIKKINSKSDDENQNGTLGTVLGSISHPALEEIGYFVEWDTSPKRATFVIGSRILA